MEKFITATGKTIDLAIEAALKELQMDRDSVSVEVLENPKSGFLGIGAVPAKVKVTYEVPDEEVKPAPALSSASRSKPKKQEPKTEPLKPLNPINPKPRTEAPKADAPKAEPPKQERRPEAPKQPRPEKRQAPKEDRSPPPRRRSGNTPPLRPAPWRNALRPSSRVSWSIWAPTPYRTPTSSMKRAIAPIWSAAMQVF